MKQGPFKRIEQKYLFPAGHKEMILAWLEHVCVPDPLYPSSDVSSLYYDTPGLVHYYESRNGEYLRTKVRLRWYADLRSSDPGAGVRCYLEIKSKQGAVSEKKRTAVTIAPRGLVDELFSNEQILDLPDGVYDLEYRASGMLVPVLLVQYRRHRYVDPDSQSGIAVDAEIRCTRANQTFIHGMPPVHFDVAVLETKGMNRGIPGVLNPIASYLRKSTFSKYGSAIESLMHPLGRRV
jgi:hypothetical protein